MYLKSCSPPRELDRGQGSWPPKGIWPLIRFPRPKQVRLARPALPQQLKQIYDAIFFHRFSAPPHFGSWFSRHLPSWSGPTSARIRWGSWILSEQLAHTSLRFLCEPKKFRRWRRGGGGVLQPAILLIQGEGGVCETPSNPPPPGGSGPLEFGPSPRQAISAGANLSWDGVFVTVAPYPAASRWFLPPASPIHGRPGRHRAVGGAIRAGPDHPWAPPRDSTSRDHTSPTGKLSPLGSC